MAAYIAIRTKVRDSETHGAFAEASRTSRADERSALRVALRVAGHIAAIVMIYLIFSFSLFLGLQVSTVYGNICMAVSAAAAIAYALRSSSRPEDPR